MLKLCKKLGFGHTPLSDIDTVYRDNDITFSHCDKNTMPLEPFAYVLIDTKKWDQAWQADAIRYLPRHLTDLYFNEQLWSPGDAIAKARDKIGSIRQYLEQDRQIWCPVFTPDVDLPLSIGDGRHRYWVVRDLALPYFPAAVETRYLNRLLNMDVLYHPGHSDVFDPYQWQEWA
ncbi:hypothetical protein IX95_25905 [Vibrio sp. B183]|uniref:hypothetical protein n=1 Tax=Vibrio sp. B183 TaxID=1526762 RepID=UPI000500FF55|nr:hypothetical protein [Vibrio sp. B183]KFI09154.1 hypothetical protein IX95_25905 [Vibrio sp. B183]